MLIIECNKLSGSGSIFLYTQIELNRKRESDLDQLRKSQQAQNDEHDKVVSDLRKKHTTAVKDLEEQLENIQKAKSR